jgi:hypothetical protein
MNKLFNSFWWSMKWWSIRDFFNPKQEWLLRNVPNHWCDKVELIPLVMFEMLIHFVEDEKGLDGIWGPHYEENDTWRSIREPVRKELEDAYNYIKTDRPLLQKALDESYPQALDRGDMLDNFDPVMGEDGKVKHYTMRSCEQIYGMSYEEAYREVHRLEKLIFERDTETMMTIIKHREYLWT